MWWQVTWLHVTIRKIEQFLLGPCNDWPGHYMNRLQQQSGPSPWLAPLPWHQHRTHCSCPPHPAPSPASTTLPAKEVHTLHQTLPHSGLSCTSCVWNIFPAAFKIKEINKTCNVTEEKVNTCQQLIANMQALQKVSYCTLPSWLTITKKCRCPAWTWNVADLASCRLCHTGEALPQH